MDCRFIALDGQKIRSQRLRLGWSQVDLAEKAIASVNTIADAEAGHPKQPATALQIVDAFDKADRKRGGKGIQLEDLLPEGETSPGTVKPDPYRGSAPLPPGLFVGREEAVKRIRNLLIRRTEKERNIAPVRIVVRGIGGLGKTSIAARIAYDGQIASAFPDGILWTSLGTEPKVLDSLRVWARSLGAPDAHNWSAEEAPNRLASLLAHSRKLLIIDDVWRAAHAQPFLLGGSDCATLITTRDTEVALALAPQPNQDVYPLPVLSDHDALHLLDLLAHEVVEEHGKPCEELVKVLEGLPLALQVAGRLLSLETAKGLKVETLLSQLTQTSAILSREAPSDMTDLSTLSTPTLAALFKKSTDVLPGRMKVYFAYLSRLRSKPAIFGLDILKSLWDVEDAASTVGEFVARGLIERTPDGFYQMHSLLVMHAKSLLKR